MELSVPDISLLSRKLTEDISNFGKMTLLITQLNLFVHILNHLIRISLHIIPYLLVLYGIH